MKSLENAPRIYVGTYAQYNSGSLFGKWFELSEYESFHEFINACLEYHSQEPGGSPELMFQDWEHIPGTLICEYNLDEKAFDYFNTAAQLDAVTQDAFQCYCEHISCWPSNKNDIDTQLEEFQACYHGYFGNESNPRLAFAYQYLDETGLLDGLPKIAESYFDYEAFARDLFLEGYCELNGHVFSD